MTFPLNLPDEPGESEFSHGKGLMSSEAQRQKSSPALEVAWPSGVMPESPWEPQPYERMKAIQRTDSANPLAVANYAAESESTDNKTGTKWVREP